MARLRPPALIAAALLGATFAVGAEPVDVAKEGRLLDQAVAPDGVVLSVRVLSETHLAIGEQGPKNLALEVFPLEDVLPDAQVVAAKVCRHGKDRVALAIVAKRGAGHSYHWALESADPKDPWTVSDAIFEDPDLPFRIVEVRNPSGDTIEITFRRGDPAPDAAQGLALEERTYVDCCPVDSKVSVSGRSRLRSLVEGPSPATAEPTPAPASPKPSPR